MVVCPNCNHSNPDGAQACEACYTPLPATTSCPNCNASVQTDATFCGQCGFKLQSINQSINTEAEVTEATEISAMPLVSPEPLVQPEPLIASTEVSSNSNPPPVPPTLSPNQVETPEASVPPPPPVAEPITSQQVSPNPPPPAPTVGGSSRTQLQQPTAKLLHVQTNTVINLPLNLAVIHIGKSNDRIPPDVDVSGFPNSEIVSRIHADIRVEGDAFYIEDVGSSNGTYINNLPLLPGNRHRLRAGDRIALGKGDLVTLLFQS